VLYLSRRDVAGTIPLTATWDAFRLLAFGAAPFVLLAYAMAAVMRTVRRRSQPYAPVDLMELVDVSAPWVLLAWIAASLVVPLLHGQADSTLPRATVDASGTLLQRAALAIVGLLFAISIVRRGARGFLGALRVVGAS
jgi:hypothetical protein